MPNILVNIEDQTGGNSSGSWGNVPGLSATGITVAGTGSVLLIIGTVAVLPEPDSTAWYRPAVDGAAVNYPNIQAFSDVASGEETNCPTVAFAVTGLSAGTHSFALQWLTQTGSPSKSTARTSSLLVLELTANASIKYDTYATSSANPSTSWGNLFSSGNVSIAGTGSVVLLFANVPMSIDNSSDYSIDYSFSVDGTREGAVTCSDADATNENNGWSGIHALTGLTPGNHTFELQYQDRSGTPSIEDTGYVRTFQVIEITSGATLKSSIISAGAYTGAGSSWSDDPNLDATVNIAGTASTVLHIANISMLDSGPDDTGAFRLEIDGAQVGADVTQFVDWTDGGTRTLLAAVKTGLSAGNHTFNLGWYEVAADAFADTARNRSQFVIEFLGITYKLEGTTKDNDGNALGSCDCFLNKLNGDGSATPVDYVESNVSTGAYSFTGIGDNDADYFVIAWKDNTPHIFDATDYVLTPVIET